VTAVAGRRAFVAFAASRKLAASRACGLLKVSRRRLGYVGGKTCQDAELADRLKELSGSHPRYGVRRLHAMLRRDDRPEGQAFKAVNLKRVRRLCRVHGLMLKQKRRRKRRGIGIGVPCKAEHPNHVWAYDFVEDITETGRKLRVLTIADEFTRECVAVEVEHRMNAQFVAQTLLGRFAERGVPSFIRSDNGPEFIAKHLMRVFSTNGVQALHIDPGSPWQNGLNERFNGTLRDECLNIETFHNRAHARALITLFGRSYNQLRPHSSLGYLTPEEFAKKWKNENDGCAGGGVDSGAPPPNPRDLSHCSPPAGPEDKDGSTEVIDRPDSRMALHAGAPVASQQSRILRVDEATVTTTQEAGKFPAQIE